MFQRARRMAGALTSQPQERLRLLRVPAANPAAGLCLLIAACGGEKIVLPNDTVPAAIAVVRGNGQAGTVGALLADSVIVRVTDAGGRPVEDQPVTFSVTAGGGTVAPLTSNTNADGRAGVRWTLGATAGTQTGQAKVTGSGAPANLVAAFSATASSAGAAAVAAVSGNGQTGTAGSALADSLVVRVTDAGSNPVAGVSVAWSAAGGGTVSAPNVPTGADGRSAVKWTLGAAAGSQSVTASATGLVGSPIVFNGTAVVGAAGKLSITTQPSGTAQSGVAFARQPQIQLLDANGNVVHQPGIAVTAELVSGPGASLIGSATAATDLNGLATFSGLGLSAPAGSYTLNFTGASLSGVTSDPIVVGAGSAVGLSVSLQPSTTASSGVPLTTQPQIQLVDGSGNAVAQSGKTVIAAIQSGSATLSGTTSVATDGSGVAAFTNLTLSGSAGSQVTLAFGATGLSGVASNTITIGAGAVSASKSTLTVAGSPITASAGASAATITVTARDASNNVIPGAAVSVDVTGNNSVTQPAGGVANGSGVATATVSSTEAGIKTVTATINGTTITQQGTVAVDPGPVSAAQSTVSAAPASIAAVSGTSTITVTVRDGFGNAIPGATVALSATGGGNSITPPPGPTNASGVAIGSLSSSTAGPKTVSASATKSPAAAVAITQTATVTVGIGTADAGNSTLTISPSTVTVGVGSATITVTARDAGGNTISGAAVSVSATGSGNTITPSSGTTDGTGVFTASYASLESGVKTITATINGTTLTAQPAVTVSPAATTTTLSLSGTTTVVGQSITASWTVTPEGTGTPTGTVTVSGAGGSCSAPVADGSCALAPTTAGANAVFTASYAGDGNFAASTRTATRTVGAAATTTVITSDSPDPSNAGQSVTVAFAVTADVPGGGTPTGTVTVSDGVQGCFATVAAGSCSAVFTTLGARTLTATYAGNANYLTSAGTANHAVQANGATVSVSGSPTSSVTGQTVTFTATVTGGSGTPTGTVQFQVDGSDAGPPVTLSGGSAQFSTQLDAGSRTITANYSGDGTYASGSGSLASYVVSKGATTVNISGDSPDPSVAGASYTVTFAVFASAPASGTPTGTVTVSDGTATCTGSAPSGSCALASPTSGSKTLTVTYDGNADFATSSQTTRHTVSPATASVTVSSSGNPSLAGEAVTFTATVSGAAGMPAGSVQFAFGGTPVGSPVALDAGGVATTTTTSLAVGPHSVTATYGGDATYAAGAAGTLAGGQDVNQGATTTAVTLSSGTDPSVAGSTVTFTATISVTAPASGSATGTVQFQDGGSDLGTPQSITAGAASLTTSALAAGTHSITAIYAGDADFTGSTSPALSHTVTAANGAPSATADGYGTAEDAPLSVPVGTGVLANDSDPDSDPLTAVLDAGPANGALTLNADGSFSYTPDADFNGADQFSYHATDGIAPSATVVVSLTISAVNDAPMFTAGADQTLTSPTGPQTVAGWATGIAAGPADEAGQALTFSVTGNSNPAIFTTAPAVAADGTLTWEPSGVAGSSTITIELTDDGGTANGGVDTSPTQSFTITVN
jgi:hypothetical protein